MQFEYQNNACISVSKGLETFILKFILDKLILSQISYKHLKFYFGKLESFDM